ncbi:MAG: NAD(P)-dependent alcohol dehydrogenase [Pseudomonadales bacterium]
MRAIVHDVYGGPEVLRLESLEQPEVGEQELLIRVHASVVNRTDCHMLRAKPFIMRFVTGMLGPNKSIPGTAFSGTVSAVGSAVSGYAPGDEVFGFSDTGVCSFADYTTLEQSRPIEKKPAGVSHAEAAASVEGAHYGYNNVNRVKLQPGQPVLVNGASGAVGIAIVQLLKHYGAHVTAVCNGANLQRLRSLGADAVIDYEQEDFTARAQTFDAVFDAVGKSSFAKCKPLLNPGGVYLPSEMGWLAQNFALALVTPWFRGRKVIFPFPLNTQRSLRVVAELLDAGKFVGVIDRTYELEQVQQAYRYVETGQKTGNVVISLVAG